MSLQMVTVFQNNGLVAWIASLIKVANLLKAHPMRAYKQKTTNKRQQTEGLVAWIPPLTKVTNFVE